jgi:hypothetical protein
MPDANGKPTPEELEAALFILPETKQDLHQWIRVYLGINLPGIRVDPDSNSSPMDLVWELYNAARTNDPAYSQVLAYAARDSFKTFSAAIFEVLCFILLERSVAHMAAIESQAKKSQQYLKRHINRPYIRKFITSKNERYVELTRHHNPVTGQNLTVEEYNALPVQDQAAFREIKHYVTIVICTIAGANSEHVPVMVVDEVDVVENPDAYEEAKMIPAPMNGKMPITLYTSTRKYSYGLVQKEIDKQDETGLIIRHWNLLDVTHPCPASRHEPEKPKVVVYYNDATLKTVSEGDYELFDSTERDAWKRDEGYHGCLHNCRLFAACRGRLATKSACPKCDGNGAYCGGFLKPVEHTQNVFRKVAIDKAQAQLLCRKPSSEGLIYPNFSREIHMKSPAELALIIDGLEHPESFSKSQLIDLLKERGARFVAGIDHGFTHNFVVVLGAIYAQRLFIFDVIAQAELELSQKVQVCLERVTPHDPEVWADTENPGDNKTLKKDAHLRIKEWTKGKGSVVDGISLVRLAIMPAMGKPEDVKLYMIRHDEGCELLAQRISQYHWTTDAAGRLTKDPDDEDDDECDALRYLVMNAMGIKTKASVSEVDVLGDRNKLLPLQEGRKQYTVEGWMRQVITERTGIDYEEEEPTQGKGRKGSFSWDM